jgi:hypothetical protein
MTSQRSAPAADPGGAAAASLDVEELDVEELDVEELDSDEIGRAGHDLEADGPPSGFERPQRADLSKRDTGTFPKAPQAPQGSLDSAVVDELTRRLPTSELVKIIKGALECGRRNLPFTESDFLRAMTFGSTALPAPTRQPPRGPRTPRG